MTVQANICVCVCVYYEDEQCTDVCHFVNFISYLHTFDEFYILVLSNKTYLKVLHDFQLLPQSRCELLSSGLLHCELHNNPEECNSHLIVLYY